MLFNLQTGKFEKVIMLHKTDKPEDLIGSYGPLSLTSCLGKLLEKAVPDNQSNWAKYNQKFNNQQNGYKKNKTGALTKTCLNYSKQLNLISIRVIPQQASFLILRKPLTKSGLKGFSLS